MAVIVLRLTVLNAFALSAAPVIASSELAALLGELLVSAGICTSSELVDMSCDEMKDKLRPIVSSETFPTDYPDAMSNLKGSIVNLVTSPAANTTTALVDSAVSSWITGLKDDYSCLNLTFTTDLNGCGALYERYRNGSLDYRVYCDYIVISSVKYCNLNGLRCQEFYSYGELTQSTDYVDDYDPFSCQLGMSLSSSSYSVKLYGDVRYNDGTPAETDDEAIPIIGEADGTTVTPDMLNPDGTVTIDGTTYYPEDYIDWDKFKDTAIIDLLNDILARLDKADVKEPDLTDEIVDSITDSVDVTVSEELSDFVVPTGIASVFPFCLPVDFVRGIQLLSAEPVAPVLEIPFDVPEFGAFKGYSTTLTIEFEKYDKYFSVFRWGIYLCFCFMLIFVSTKIVKGAGS